MKKLLPLILLVITCATQAAELHLKPADIERLELRLTYETKPQVRVYFQGGKLEEVQDVVESNLGKPISIYMNESLIVEPTLKEPLKAKLQYLTLTFADFATAAQVARGFVPTK